MECIPIEWEWRPYRNGCCEGFFERVGRASYRPRTPTKRRVEGRISVASTPEALKRKVAEGVLAFPATAFNVDGSFDPAAFARHIDDLVRFSPVAIVPAGGAGELFSLSLDEHRRVIEIAVKGTSGVPVIAGAGYGVAIAVEMARTAQRLGAD